MRWDDIIFGIILFGILGSILLGSIIVWRSNHRPVPVAVDDSPEG